MKEREIQIIRAKHQKFKVLKNLEFLKSYSSLSNNLEECNKCAGWKSLLNLGDFKNQNVFNRGCILEIPKSKNGQNQKERTW